AKSAAETNQSKPINPKINNRAARKTADQTRDGRRERTVSLVVMLHPNSVTSDFCLRSSESRNREWGSWQSRPRWLLSGSRQQPTRLLGGAYPLGRLCPRHR